MSASDPAWRDKVRGDVERVIGVLVQEFDGDPWTRDEVARLAAGAFYLGSAAALNVGQALLLDPGFVEYAREQYSALADEVAGGAV